MRNKKPRRARSIKGQDGNIDLWLGGQGRTGAAGVDSTVLFIMGQAAQNWLSNGQVALGMQSQWWRVSLGRQR